MPKGIEHVFSLPPDEEVEARMNDLDGPAAALEAMEGAAKAGRKIEAARIAVAALRRWPQHGALTKVSAKLIEAARCPALAFHVLKAYCERNAWEKGLDAEIYGALVRTSQRAGLLEESKRLATLAREKFPASGFVRWACADLERRTLYAADDIRIDFYPVSSAGKVAVITFDTIFDDWNALPYGFDFLLGQNVDIIAVRKGGTNFYQPLSVEAFHLAVAPVLHSYERVVAYGSSLGAYAALYFCSHLDCEVIASSPRVSLHPTYGVDHWRQQVEFRHSTMDRLAQPKCRARILYDPRDPTDRAYIEGEILPRFARANVIRVPYAGHPANYFVSEIGFISRLVKAVIEGGDVPAVDRRQKGKSWTYLQVLAEACLARNKLTWAKSLAERSAAMNPKNCLAHRTLARVCVALGDPESARPAIDKAHELNRGDEQSVSLMIEIYRALQREDEVCRKFPTLAGLVTESGAKPEKKEEELRGLFASTPMVARSMKVMRRALKRVWEPGLSAQGPSGGERDKG